MVSITAMASLNPSSCGRFAPSPTGPLHFGSLVAALGSYLEARRRGGRWLVRMEDVDVPRCKPEHADAILRTLEAFGFAWDGAVEVQSTRIHRYRDVLDELQRQGVVYPCACTRSELSGATPGVDGAPLYPGNCRHGLPPGRAARAWRLRVAGCIAFDDAVQGRLVQDLPRDVGDAVLLRADGYFAYQLAVVVDDAAQGVDHVVRGADLIHSTARQIYLQRLLGYATPDYAHLPVAVDATGAKLSKQTLAAPVTASDPAAALFAAARFLSQNPPEECRLASVDFFWAWALAHWRLDQVSPAYSIPIEETT